MSYEKYELFPRYDARASFYGKAHELEYDDGTVELKSYSTIVAKIIPTPIPPILPKYMDGIPIPQGDTLKNSSNNTVSKPKTNPKY